MSDRCVVLVSANSEWRALKSLLPHAIIESYPYGEMFSATVGVRIVLFFHSGWGKIASAGAFQYILDRYAPTLTVNLGTCGGIAGEVTAGDVILVTRTLVYDIVELMSGSSAANGFYSTELDLTWLKEPLPNPARRGLIASADADLLPEKIPFLKAQGALAADWESAALAWVAHKNGARLLILRAVSDLVHEAEGGEAYGNMELFRERTLGIMKMLLGQLPDWLASALP